MNLEIHQIYFQSRQRPGLDPAFLPYDNSGSSKPDQREFYVFRKEYEAGRATTPGENGDVVYRGYVSWKFQKKTGISGRAFHEFCGANPGYDVYMINPFPLMTCLGNVWDSGEFFHPGMKELVEFVFAELGYGIQLQNVPRGLRLTGYCNFWAGNKKFWDEYMAFCLPIADYIENRMPEDMRKKLFAPASHSTKASQFSYIFERLLSTFLAANPHIRALNYRYSEAELKRIYSPEEAQLVDELYRLEAANPGSADPISASPIHQLALGFYRKIRWEEEILRPLVRRVVQVTWRMVPFRMRILKSSWIHGFADKLDQRMQPKAELTGRE